ncbi:PAS domain S-box-containing protein/diguanylate cyclase (GGDEF) domain-containing protein [Amphritea atlantica]|uniref:cyclic-guanylate-specific phosphodiesterase n=1 Tax=Amphritea atlantica TaxID=355243 RepID=A0A1H9FZD5_9GAMM|nr:EAL domain-containing protein [Amphritea atlantica]SEQ42828.1 PAS domain S-box-containing protein/diguanylate cyclase (GGDEF) domain-containing protein [Amphritea atlantica]
MKARAVLFALTILCCLVAATGVIANYLNLVSFSERDAQRNAENTVDLLQHELDAVFDGYYRQVAFQAVLPEIQNYLLGEHTDVTPLLNHVCTLSGASLCYILDKQGIFVAANDFQFKAQTLNQDFAFRPYFKEAVASGASVYPALGASTHERGVYFSHRVLDTDGQFIGVVVNKYPLQPLEQVSWQHAGHVVLLDRNGIIFASNRPDWIFSSLLPLDPMQQATIRQTGQYGTLPEPGVEFKWLPDGVIQGDSGEHFRAYQASVQYLPGWSLTYLDSTDLSPFSSRRSLWLWLMIGFSLVVIGMVSFLYRQGSRQILLRQQAEAGLKRSETRLQQLSQVSTEAIIMHRGGQILDCNPVAEEMFGYKRRELMNLPLLQLFKTDHQQDVEQYYNHDEPGFEAEAIRADGVLFPVEVSYQFTQIDGESVGMSCLRDISERKEYEHRVQYQAQFDALTNLPNRKLMRARLNRSIINAQSKGNLVILMFIDLDDFKKINDTLGHEVGDELLVMVARRLQDAVREDDTLARYGGDEFILLLENQDNLYNAEIVAQKILKMLAMAFQIQERSFYISGSIGIAVSPGDGVDPDELLKKADTAMYRVKEQGRNGFSFYSPEMNDYVLGRLEVEQQLRGALEHNEFCMHYQPIYCLNRKKVIGAEALIRWNNPTLGLVSPEQFIPVAEQTGLILPIGEWIIREVCEQGVRWRRSLGEDYRIALNVSPRQFRDGQIVPVLLRIFEETGFDPTCLEIEITEGLLVRNDDSTAQTLSQLKSLGISLSMDDFGTGYSSLSYLKQFPFDVIKIDRTFVRDLADDPGDQQLVTAALAMAKGMGLKVIAEGVENQFQMDFLASAGCDALQGYYLGRPVSAEEFQEKIIPSSEFRKMLEV